jgi:hypothetical protein
MIKQKIIYIQSWGTYQNETLVCIGVSYEEIYKCLKKIKVETDMIKQWECDIDLLDNCLNGAGLFWFNHSRSILWLKDWKNDWKHYDILLHELFHAVYYILGKGKNMMSEDEGMAYQQEFLFKAIRRKLSDLLSKKEKAYGTSLKRIVLNSK